MSARSFEKLLELAYAPERPDVFPDGATAIYHQFEQAYTTAKGRPTDDVNYRFEILRLGVAIAFVKAFTRLAQNENTKEVLVVLQQASRARNTQQIDQIIQKQIALFDNLYHEIFVNEQRDHVLSLFEATLDASAKEELDELLEEGLEVLQEIDFDHIADEDEDDNEPLDDDFIKSIK